MEVTSHEFIIDYLKGNKNILGGSNKITLTKSNLNDLENNMYLNSYGVFNVDFKFPSSVKYPCIPVTATDTMTIYPLTGSNVVVTKYELKLALEIGCTVKIHRGYVVPYTYKMKEENVVFQEKPYSSIYKK